MKTHVVSVILNIAQKVDEDWPLQIFDHDGNLHHVILQPGEMVFYESGDIFSSLGKLAKKNRGFSEFGTKGGRVSDLNHYFEQQ